MNNSQPDTRRPARTMQPPAIPIDEADRLLALYRLRLLDTPPTESFDRITRIAAKILGVPILLVSLVDKDRQWFKSCVGLDATQTSREVSFCGHVIFERRPIVVGDATRDSRFAGNPLVTGAPFIRAYLGVPLFTLEQQPIGTLCAVDVLPRDFTADEIETMREFAQILEDTIHAMELAAKSAGVLLYASKRERLFRDAFEQATVGMAHTGLNGRLRRVNRRAPAMFGFSKEEMLSRPLVSLTHPDDLAEHTQLFERIVAGEIEDYRLDTRLQTKDAGYLPVRLCVSMGRDTAGQPDHLVAAFEELAV
jgi:diguanylate cyclase